jgi:SP family sugar:H+ symporter-like MFS transporter
MPPGDGSRIEAPVTTRAYLLCAFAAFGGIMYGYDSGYINGVLGMPYFKQEFGDPVSKDLDSSGYHVAVWEKSKFNGSIFYREDSHTDCVIFQV